MSVTPSGRLACELDHTPGPALGTMHNINLQRVDRITMAQGLKARTPFLDRDLIDFAQSIPASLKLKVTDPGTRATTEKWVLQGMRGPAAGRGDLAQKAQFDEGSGTVAALDRALAGLLGGPVDREREAALYERLLRAQYRSPDLVLANAGTWAADRIAI
jgi:asparagine synthase (glutamine-hydrolysing)